MSIADEVVACTIQTICDTSILLSDPVLDPVLDAVVEAVLEAVVDGYLGSSSANVASIPPIRLSSCVPPFELKNRAYFLSVEASISSSTGCSLFCCLLNEYDENFPGRVADIDSKREDMDRSTRDWILFCCRLTYATAGAQAQLTPTNISTSVAMLSGTMYQVTSRVSSMTIR